MILGMDPRVSSLQARLGLAEAQVRQLRALLDGLSERGPRSSRHPSSSPETRRAPA